MIDVSAVFLELGAAIVGLAILARIASRWALSAIPLYLLAGVAFGKGGLMPLPFSEGFVHIGAEIGVILLLFMLGLEYTGDQLVTSLRAGTTAGLLDAVLNFLPGVTAAELLGWNFRAAILLGGITYISSSGVIAKMLTDLRRLDRPETPIVLSILVIEDLAMAVYLPIVAVLLSGEGMRSALVSIAVALAILSVGLTVAIRYAGTISRIVAHESDEIILLTTFGAVLLVAGIAEHFQVSAAIGAFLVGIALSGPLAERAHRLVGPLRDLFAAVFFFFFGLQIDPATLPAVLPAALAIGVVTALTKFITGWWSARRAGIDIGGRISAGATLIARGEFSIVIAGLGAEAAGQRELGSLAAAYVLFMAILGPLVVRAMHPLENRYSARFDPAS
jgi:CPA2 family monovalent cation:H+ antiporter-2